MDSDEDEQRKLEMERGAQIAAQHFLSKQFNPDHTEQYSGGGAKKPSPAERALRDAYRKLQGQWRAIHEPEN